MDNVRGNGVEIPSAPFRPSTFSEWFCGANPQHVPLRTQERTHPRTRYTPRLLIRRMRTRVRGTTCPRCSEISDSFTFENDRISTTSGVSVKLTVESVAFVSPRPRYTRRGTIAAGSRCSNGKTIFSRWRVVEAFLRPKGKATRYYNSP